MELNETVFEHTKGCSTFTVTAAETWSVAMIHKLKARYPEQVEIVYTNRDKSLLVHLPLDWMRIVPKKQVPAGIEKNLQRPVVREETSPNLHVSALEG